MIRIYGGLTQVILALPKLGYFPKEVYTSLIDQWWDKTCCIENMPEHTHLTSTGEVPILFEIDDNKENISEYNVETTTNYSQRLRPINWDSNN